MLPNKERHANHFGVQSLFCFSHLAVSATTRSRLAHHRGTILRTRTRAQLAGKEWGTDRVAVCFGREAVIEALGMPPHRQCFSNFTLALPATGGP
ncbi:hypothetical protein V2G26_006410 [Clonostachys chloroleuca]